MTLRIDAKSTEELVSGLIQGTLDINLLDLTVCEHREALIIALENRPSILSRVSSENEKAFFTFATKIDPKYFTQLNRNQYTDELAQAFLYACLSDTSDTNDGNSTCPDIVIQKSLNNKAVLLYSYLTSDNDELHCFDNDLQAPISLKSSLKIALKIDNAVALIDKLDVHISQLRADMIKEALADTVANTYKSYLGKYIKDNGIGYYTLSTSLGDVQSGFKDSIGKILAEYGISVSELIIKSITLPEDTELRLKERASDVGHVSSEPIAVTEKSENLDIVQSAQPKQAAVQADEEPIAQEVNPESLFTDDETAESDDITREEAEESDPIPSDDNPSAARADTDTNEAEPDIDCIPTETELTDTHEELVDNVKAEPHTNETSAADAVAPILPKKKNVFRTGFIIAAMTALIISAVTFAVNVGIGLIIFGAFVCMLGTVAAFNTENFREHQNDSSSEDEREEA